MPSPLKKVSEEIIHENPWWRYKRDIFSFPDGRTGEYYYGETYGWSIVVPMLPDGQLVLVKQYRYLSDRYSIEFPGGGMKVGESPSEVAKRELIEETGYSAKEFVNISNFEPHNGLFVDTAHVFLARNVIEIQNKNLGNDETEFIELIFRRPDEIEQLIRNNEIWDGQTLATWALARYYV